jgi:hypothetical protein
VTPEAMAAEATMTAFALVRDAIARGREDVRPSAMDGIVGEYLERMAEGADQRVAGGFREFDAWPALDLLFLTVSNVSAAMFQSLHQHLQGRELDPAALTALFAAYEEAFLLGGTL